MRLDNRPSLTVLFSLLLLNAFCANDEELNADIAAVLVVIDPQLMVYGLVQVFLAVCIWWREVLCSVTDLSTVTSLLMVHLLKSSCVATMAKLSKPSSKPLKIASGCINLPHLTDMQFVFGKALNRPAAARELVKCLLTILHNRTMHAGRQKLLHMVRNGTAIGICVTLFELKDIAMGDCLCFFLAGACCQDVDHLLGHLWYISCSFAYRAQQVLVTASVSQDRIHVDLFPRC